MSPTMQPDPDEPEVETPSPSASVPLDEPLPPPEDEESAPEEPASSSDLPEITLIWGDALWQAAGHPTSLHPDRLRRACQLVEALGSLRWEGVRKLAPDRSLGRSEALALFHEREYRHAVIALGAAQASAWRNGAFGFSEAGMVPFPGIAETAGLYVAAARTAVRAALDSPQARVLSLAGEQPHARPAQAQSGDIFNDVLLALLDAQAAGARVAFLNLDAEHPTVIQERFYREPLLTISLHEGPPFLYPSTGTVRETGEGAGQGYNVNLPLPPCAGDAEMREAIERVVLPLLERFAPDLLLILGGAASHYQEPLAHLRLTTHGYQALLMLLVETAPRVVLLGGSGSDADALARLWIVAVATAAGRTGELPHSLPPAYARQWGEGTLHDGRLRPLPRSLRGYVTAVLQESLYDAQRLLFPRWKLPMSGESRPPFFEEQDVPLVRSTGYSYQMEEVPAAPPPAPPPPRPVPAPSRAEPRAQVTSSVTAPVREEGTRDKPARGARRPERGRGEGGRERPRREEASPAAPAARAARKPPPPQPTESEGEARKKRRRRKKRGGGK